MSPSFPVFRTTRAIASRRGHLKRRRFLLLSAAALSGTALTSCGWTLAEVRAPVNREGNPDELYIYTWAGYTDPKLTNVFTSQTGIDTTVDTFSSNEAMLASFQAGKGQIYSVIYPSDYKVAEMIDKGFLRELDHSKLNGLENLMPAFRNSVYDPGNRYSIPISWGTTGIIYSPDRLGATIADWGDLWQYRDRLNRRLTLLDDTREVMGASLKSAGHSYNSENPAEIRQAYERLVELKPAIANFTTDAWKERLLAGDLLASMVYSADAVGVLQEYPDKGLKYVIPTSGTSLWSDTMVIPKTSPNPEGAYAWINFMLQPSVAASVTERLYFATPNEEAHAQLPQPLRQNENLFPPADVIARCERIAPLDPELIELYDQYWTRLTSG